MKMHRLRVSFILQTMMVRGPRLPGVKLPCRIGALGMD
ncbi:hypothetical protein B2K_40200 [Paenibacillus mucilaginosus K02]|uniref:Uncharacterized protein n=1 Tax=Paenibacillus mucilaginosus K02 TaxID=997761 RepID=R9ULX6_9BACL|nr:hypothetical protein B2K_40200 [Paenibacillus mucilaginosus K02]